MTTPDRGDYPPRYVVLVWVHGAWSVNYTTDDKGTATSVFAKATGHVPCALVVDTIDAEGLGVEPKSGSSAAQAEGPGATSG